MIPRYCCPEYTAFGQDGQVSSSDMAEPTEPHEANQDRRASGAEQIIALTDCSIHFYSRLNDCICPAIEDLTSTLE